MTSTSSSMPTSPRRPIARLTVASMIATVIAIAAATPVGAEEATVEIRVDLAAEVIDVSQLDVIQAETGMIVTRPLLASRGIYEFSAAHEMKLDESDDPKKVADVVDDARKALEKSKHIEWVEVQGQGDLTDDRFHAWPATVSEAATAADIAEQPAFAYLNLPAVREIATGAGTVVAVLDTGVDTDHEFFDGRILPGVDLVDDDDDPNEVADGLDQDGDGLADEAHGHGTFVAGIVLQIAPDARILPVRVLDADGNGDRYAVVEGIEYAVEHGADIINLSFGLNGELNSKRLEDAVKNARDEGVIVVAAAGNNANDRKHFPAALKDVVSVTAVDETNADIAHYANRGKWVTVAAPGNRIVSTTADGGYARWSGTSMATPVVSGGYAVVAEHLDGEKAKKIIEAIQKTATKMSIKDTVATGNLNLGYAVAS